MSFPITTIFLCAWVLAIVPTWASAADILGYTPGMTLAEAKAVPVPGAAENKKRRFTCFDEPGLVKLMADYMPREVAKYETAGILWCLLVENDSLNKDYWADASPKLGTARVGLWFYFIDEGAGPKLATMRIAPPNRAGEKVIHQVFSTLFGQPKAEVRKINYSIAGPTDKDFLIWSVGENVIECVKDFLCYYSNPTLKPQLQKHFDKMVGGSFYDLIP